MLIVKRGFVEWFNNTVKSGDLVFETKKKSERTFNKTLCECVEDNCVSKLIKMIDNFRLFQHITAHYFGGIVTPENFCDLIAKAIINYEKEVFDCDC